MKSYRQSLDELYFTQEEKNAMVDRLTAGESRGSGKVRSIRRTVTVGVAAALLMTMGVGAAVVLTPAGEVFASVFGVAPAQTEILDRMGVPIGASDTADGVTITADAIIGDTYSYAIVYSIARDDGQPLAEGLEANELGLLPLIFDQADTNIGMWGGSHGFSYIYDADPTDNAVQYVEMMTSDTPIQPGTATARFSTLALFDEETGKTVLADGSWELRFQFRFPESGVSLEAGQSFQLSGVEATLDAVTISPLSIQVDYTVWEEVVWDHQDQADYTVWEENWDQGDVKMGEHDQRQLDRFLFSLPISVNFADGTVMELTDFGGGVHPKAGKTACQKGGFFGEILDLSQVESVTIGEVTLPVAAE